MYQRFSKSFGSDHDHVKVARFFIVIPEGFYRESRKIKTLDSGSSPE
jgi:hypothetical protein